MIIEEKVSQSTEFKNLLSFFNTPSSKKSGHFCTVTGNTIDSQNLILSLLTKISKKAVIYSSLFNINIYKYLRSTDYLKNFSFSDFVKTLEKKNLERTDKVTKTKEYSVRGDTITIWPSIYEKPIRLNFFGEELESIEQIDEVYMSKLYDMNLIVLGDESLLEDEIESQSVNILNPQSNISKNIILFTNREDKKIKTSFHFHFTYPQLFFNRLDIFKKEIKKKYDWDIKISSIHGSELEETFLKYRTNKKYESGFENSNLKLAVYTDRELFGTIFIANEKAKSQKKINRYLAQLEGEVEVDDFIVHEDYGIAIYKGIQQREVMGRLYDYLILEYDEKDKLSVPLEQVNKLTKYIGPDEHPPKITRLGKANWKAIKAKVKKRVKILARELLRHYALAEITKSESFIKQEWEEEFASSFEFEETSDQKRAINELLADLEEEKPMNRILVGDVGFGKTEVAIRGAFRTVLNGKQVAVLCPTTILVSQHFSVFKHRMSKYPVRIATLSRFGTRKENLEIVERIKNGKVDIVIGTHRLLSNDIKFKDLGMLVIDEEQKFGVAQKEKIKKLAYKSNVLSMSATPIPRTLSMALSSLRDISIITTPPPGRKAIKTDLKFFDWSEIASILQKEVDRGGQVYFVHNEVRTIESIRNKLEKVLPNIRFKTGHGQMHPSTLEKVMREFYEYKFDCLICTTIIENGIDIQNVNTIIINKAQNFGLSQLYQLRGRVGRGQKQAYCYLFYNVKDLLKENPVFKELKLRGKKVPLVKAKARLEAILESQELGSGFKVASKDLEIRGAGNLLGSEQHGSISKVGLGLYTQLLAEEVESLKEKEKNE